MRELIPAASRFGLLVNPNNENAKAITSDLKAAAATIGVEIEVVRATNSTSPVPIENPARTTSVTSSTSNNVLRSAAKVS